MRPAGPVNQTRLALGVIAVPPLRDRPSRQGDLAIRLGLGGASLDPLDQRQTPRMR